MDNSHNEVEDELIAVTVTSGSNNDCKTLLVSKIALLRNSGLSQHYLSVASYQAANRLPLPSKFYSAVDPWQAVINLGNDPMTGRYNMQPVAMLDVGDDSEDNSSNSKAITLETEINKLLLAFDLASYLDDDNYFNFLVRCLVVNSNKLPEVLMSHAELRADIKHHIYLHCPYLLLPEELRDKASFLKTWLDTFSHKESISYNKSICVMTVNQQALFNYNSLSKANQEAYDRLVANAEPREYDVYPHKRIILNNELNAVSGQLEFSIMVVLYLDHNCHLRYRSTSKIQFGNKSGRLIQDSIEHRWPADGGDIEICNDPTVIDGGE